MDTNNVIISAVSNHIKICQTKASSFTTINLQSPPLCGEPLDRLNRLTPYCILLILKKSMVDKVQQNVQYVAT